MLNIAICDDESSIREILVDYVERYRKDNKTEINLMVFESADRLLVDYPKELDILFLDIAMDGVDGMTAARNVRLFDEKLCIIFVTNMVNYAFQGYEVRAFGFIKKPVNYTEFEYELDSAIRQIDSREDKMKYISVRSSRKSYFLRISDIIYCEVRDHDMFICEKEKSAFYTVTMTELEKALKNCGFFRCHGSFLVNSEYIESIDTASLA